jgi:hypothetical protein
LPTWTAVVLTLPVTDEVRVTGARVVDDRYPPIDVTAVAVPPQRNN